MKRVRPSAIPTWVAPDPAVSKKTRSPARMLRESTERPSPNIAWLEWGRESPVRAKAHMTRPLQSKLDGPEPPQAYGSPILVRAARRAASALPPELCGFGLDWGGGS